MITSIFYSFVGFLLCFTLTAQNIIPYRCFECCLNKQSNYLKLLDNHRNYNGTRNDHTNINKGAVDAYLYSEITPAPTAYDLLKNLPNPRVVSNMVGAIQPQNEPSSQFSFLLTIFGQFIDHDLSLTPLQRGNSAQKIQISIPKCDPHFDKECTGTKSLSFTRSNYEQIANERFFLNKLTSWIDGSMIYGISNENNLKLRQGAKDGKLANSGAYSFFELPIKEKNSSLFLNSGDQRINQNVILTSLHVIFFREHNRIAEKVRKLYKDISDQDVFNIARNYVIGLIQKIVYDDFLPLILGKKTYNQLIGQYKGYNHQSIPDITTEFSTAAFRFGHSLLKSKVNQIANNGFIIETLQLKNLFFNPKLITESSVGEILKGASETAGKIKNSKITDGVRNFLITSPQGQFKQDLFTLNILRGRDHRLRSYNDYRQKYGLPKIQHFQQITDYKTAKLLQEVYQSPNQLQLWVGIISQTSLPGAVLGPLGSKIVGNQFKRIRQSDNYWYEKIYPTDVIRQIKQTTLGNIIARNSQISNLNQNVFLNSNIANSFVFDMFPNRKSLDLDNLLNMNNQKFQNLNFMPSKRQYFDKFDMYKKFNTPNQFNFRKY